MEIQFFTLVFWWMILGLLSVGLIMLRDDAYFLFKDVKDSFHDGIFYGISFIIAYIFYSPLTLPYSINYFIKKWKYN